MRNAFASEISALAAADARVTLLVGDIGNKLFDQFKANCPDRFINCGVAEANMVSVAAGMALSGLRPVTYTIAQFMTTRCLEQIRIDLCYQNLPVVIVGVGAGLSYASLNATHHACEDIAFLRVLPNLTVVCPGDPLEVRLALREALRAEGPVYIRLGKKGEPNVHAVAPDFGLGRGILVAEGTDVMLLSTGTMLPVAVDAARMLGARGISAATVSLHTVKPLDSQLLCDAFAKYAVVVTIEEHSIHGGLGGSVAEWLSDQPTASARLLRIGTSDSYLYAAGEQEFAREKYGLTAEQIASRVGVTYQQALITAPSRVGS